MEADRELLEKAATAAGYKHNGWHYADGSFALEGFNDKRWNPLTDDGDALRLAASLEISVTFSSEFVNAIATQHGDDGVVPFAHESWTISNQDCYAATRRAIVRCAAEIGRTK